MDHKKKARKFQKNICFIDYAKALNCVEHNNLRKILKEMGIPDHLTCLLRNLYAGQEATVRTRHDKAVCCHPAYLTSVESTSCDNVRLEVSQAGIKTARRNSNNLRYADDTTLIAESEEELKSLLMRVKEESEKAGLKLSIQKP